MNKRSGFILVVSVLVLSTVIISIAIASAFGLAGSQNRFVGIETGLDAQALAESCADIALLKLKLNNNYLGNEVITIGSQSCTIQPVIAGPPAEIETEATVNGRPYRLHIEISDLAAFTISQWQRVSAF